MSVAYLGPEGTFTHQAAQALAPDTDLEPVPTQADALRGLDEGRYDAAVLPIDNSANGLVLPTWDAILESEDAVIVADAMVAVSFDAFVSDASVEPTVVVSHPHALAQTSDYIASLGLPTRAASSTAEACRALEPGEIGIGAAICGELYGLTTVATAVENLAGAVTQFARVERKPAAEPALPSAESIAVLAAVAPQNRPGALVNILTPFAAAGLSLVNIHVRPIPQSDREFVFVLHVQGLDEAAHAAILDQLRASGVLVSFLGRLSRQVKSLVPVERVLPERLT